MRQASSLHGVQASVLHEDGELHEVGSGASPLHGNPMRAGDGVQASSGEGVGSGSGGVQAGRSVQARRGLCSGVRQLARSRIVKCVLQATSENGLV